MNEETHLGPLFVHVDREENSNTIRVDGLINSAPPTVPAFEKMVSFDQMFENYSNVTMKRLYECRLCPDMFHKTFPQVPRTKKAAKDHFREMHYK